MHVIKMQNLNNTVRLVRCARSTTDYRPQKLRALVSVGGDELCWAPGVKIRGLRYLQIFRFSVQFLIKPHDQVNTSLGPKASKHPMMTLTQRQNAKVSRQLQLKAH
jgi:hypothetical protein